MPNYAKNIDDLQRQIQEAIDHLAEELKGEKWGRVHIFKFCSKLLGTFAGLPRLGGRAARARAGRKIVGRDLECCARLERVIDRPVEPALTDSISTPFIMPEPRPKSVPQSITGRSFV